MEVDVVSLSPEFPNDNPVLHRGVIWVCLEPTGPAVPDRAALASEPDIPPADIPPSDVEEEEDAQFLVEELEPIEAALEGEPSADPVIAEAVVEEPPPTEEVGMPVFEDVPVESMTSCATTGLPPPPDDPFTIFVCALADVAISAGSPNVASVLPGLLFDGRLPDVLDEELKDALRAAQLWDGSEVASGFVATTCAWRAILQGTSDDFSACGAAMLDEWASDLLARLLKAPAKVTTLRQELRSRGVAAFGLVEAAA